MSNLVPTARAFFADLAVNNTRDWFTDHKATYDDQIKAPAEALLADLAEWSEGALGFPVKPKLFRIHRDVRFSKDKTPYNTHLHLSWSMLDAPIALMFGLGADYCQAGVGIGNFDKEPLIKWRKAVAEEGPIVTQIDALMNAGWTMSDRGLKRVPAPYEQDHPRGDLLKRKGLILWRDITGADQADLPGALRGHFAEADRFRRTLAKTLA